MSSGSSMSAALLAAQRPMMLYAIQMDSGFFKRHAKKGTPMLFTSKLEAQQHAKKSDEVVPVTIVKDQ